MSIVTIVTMLGAGAGAAQARQAPPPGVHVDPASPTAKEYAVPFDAARAIGRGGGQAGSGTSRGTTDGGAAAGVAVAGAGASPLFGVGITPRGGSPIAGGPRSGGGSTGASGPAPLSAGGSGLSSTPPGATGSTGAAPGPAIRRSSALVPAAGAKGDAGGTSPLLLVGAVLAAGLLVGIPLRRLGRSTEPAPDDAEAQT